MSKWYCYEIIASGQRILDQKGTDSFLRKLGLSPEQGELFFFPMISHVSGIQIQLLSFCGPYFFVDESLAKGLEKHCKSYMIQKCSGNPVNLEQILNWREDWKGNQVGPSFEGGQLVRAKYGEFEGFYGTYNKEVSPGISEVMHKTCMGPYIRFHIPTLSLVPFEIAEELTQAEIRADFVDAIFKSSVFFKFLVERAKVVYGPEDQPIQLNDEVKIHA
jgi:hypothetical protein